MVWFWIFVLIISLLLALGDNLPLARWMFLVPGLNSFRVPARHVYEMILALTVLSGFGAAAIHQTYANHKVVIQAVIPTGIIFLVAAAAILLNSARIHSMSLRNGVTNLTLAAMG